MTIDFPLSEVLTNYCNVNAIELTDQISKNFGKYNETVLREQLADAIVNGSISTAEYESLTNDSYDTQEELNDWLVELWEIIFKAPFPK